MNRNFDANAFVRRIGQRLVTQFDDAREATTPSLVGGAMEQSVRDQFEQILPRGIAVGSGCVIDSFGGTSRQQDIVLYERDICPKFSVNNTPETTYYPCEGVIAVGEVKSILNREALGDAFEKIASVKQLRRRNVYHPVPDPQGDMIPIYRRYTNLHQDSILDMQKRSAESTQIFGFVLAGTLPLRLETFAQAYMGFLQEKGDDFSPNVTAVLTGEMVTWAYQTDKRREYKEVGQGGGLRLVEISGNPPMWETALSPHRGTHFAYTKGDNPFAYLVNMIYQISEIGETSDAKAFRDYILPPSGHSYNQIVHVPMPPKASQDEESTS